MAFPLILIPIVAAGLGGKKAYDASSKRTEASYVLAERDTILQQADQNMREAKDIARHALEAYGETKLRVLDHEISAFVKAFRKLKHVDFRRGSVTGDVSTIPVGNMEIRQMEHDAIHASSFLAGGAAGLAGGVLLSAGADGGVMGGGFAAASTGTAISALSGSAATNATLAWLGGGSLASGGLGVVGGMAVLGGLVIGPAIALGGLWSTHQANRALYDALDSKDEALLFQERVNKSVILLKGIAERSQRFREAVERLARESGPLTSTLRWNCQRFGADYRRFDENARKKTYLAAMTVKIIKMICDTELMDSSGKLTEAGKRMEDQLACLQKSPNHFIAYRSWERKS